VELTCPHCHGNAIVMVTGPDGRTVTVCKDCDKPVDIAPGTEADPKRQRPDGDS